MNQALARTPLIGGVPPECRGKTAVGVTLCELTCRALFQLNRRLRPEEVKRNNSDETTISTQPAQTSQEPWISQTHVYQGGSKYFEPPPGQGQSPPGGLNVRRCAFGRARGPLTVLLGLAIV